MVNFLATIRRIVLILSQEILENLNIMNKIVIKLSLSLFAFGITNVVSAQQVDKKILNWYNGTAGMQTEKAYKKVKKKESLQLSILELILNTKTYKGKSGQIQKKLLETELTTITMVTSMIFTVGTS